MNDMINLVGRFNGIDFSGVSKSEAEVFMMNECFKLGLSLDEANVIIDQISL